MISQFFYNFKSVSVILIIALCGELILSSHQSFASTEENNTIFESEESVGASIQTKSSSPFKPGDGIYVDTFPDTSSVLRGYYAVDDMGFTDFPLIGKIQIIKLTEQELEDFLKSQFRSYLRYANIRVKPVIRVSILGGVISPGLYYVDRSSSLWDVVRIAGGTTYENGIKEMVWERNRDEVVDDLVPYFQNGRSLKSIGFRSGDQLWTPSSYETFWTFFSQNLLPILTFATTMAFLYLTYRRDLIYLQTR